jgi:tRNA (cytidine32/guanosine34-2'-O)-methyltransferase
VPTAIEPLVSQRYDGLGEQSGLIVPFLACGDLRGYDADQSYPLPLTELPQSTPQPIDEQRGGPAGAGVGGATYTYLEPTQKPTYPAYKAALEEQAKRDNRKLCFSSGPESAAGQS